MTPEQLQHRLDRLERRQSWTLRATGAGILVLAAGALMAQVPAPPRTPPGTHSFPMTASRFELVDARGQTRAVLRMDNNAPVLQLHDATGGVALKLTVRGADGAIEYVDGGEVLNLMKPAPRARPLTSR